MASLLRLARHFYSSERALKAVFGSERTKDDKLNPTYLAVGRRGYHVQSHVLHMPDKFGYFSPDPPPLQTRQGYLFTLQTFLLTVPVLATVTVGVSAYHSGLNVVAPVELTLGLMVCMAAASWILSIRHHRRYRDQDRGNVQVPVAEQVKAAGWSDHRKAIAGLCYLFVVIPVYYLALFEAMDWLSARCFGWT
jgi:hypothetical protein